MINLPVSLQVWQENHVVVRVLRGEGGSRALTVTFLGSDGRAVDLTGCTPRMYLMNTEPPVFTDGTVTDAVGTAKFTVTSGMTMNRGVYACQFLLTGPNFPPLKVDGLTLYVLASNLESAVEATEEYSALINALNKADTAAAQTEQAMEDGKTAVSEAAAAVSGAKTAADLANNSASAAQSAAEAADGAADRADKAKTGADAAAANAETAAEKAGHTPQYGENGNWESWDGTAYADTGKPWKGEKGDPFAYGASYGTLTDLQAAYPDGDSKGHLVGRTAYVWAGAEWKPTGVDLSEYQKTADADAKYLSGSERGSAGGVAALGADGKIPAGQLPALHCVPNSEKGSAGGVATLDGNGKLAQDAKTLNGYGTDNGENSVVVSGRKADTAIGANSVALGSSVTASEECSYAEGYNTTASGYTSHAEGNTTTTSGNSSHAEGYQTAASGLNCHAEGMEAAASGLCAHAEGFETTASGQGAHAEGGVVTAGGTFSHAEGDRTQSNVYCSHAQGTYNKAMAGDANSYSGTADAMVIGNGTGSGSLSNCFRVTYGGKVYGLSSFNSSGADYAEFFEWEDGNPSGEDRVGHFVTLEGEKIRYADDCDFIVGIVSGAPAIVGDHPSESWSERWMKDFFGRIQFHKVDVPALTKTVTEPDGAAETVVIRPAHQEVQPVVNPDYDPTKEADYLSREKRPEWTAVGMLGKLVCIDDGTCEIDGYCKPKSGIATKADSGCRVLARLDDTHIRVLMR